MAGPAVISAAPAPLDIGFGPTVGVDPFPATGALPVEVEPGSHVAFEVWAQNDGTSNISKLFLTALTAGTFHSKVVVNTDTSGDCEGGTATGVALMCSWLQVIPGATIKVKVVLKTPSNGETMPVKFEWSTSGFVVDTKGKNKSHGDAFELPDSVALNNDDDVFAGGYLVDGDSTVVTTNPTVNRQNPQSTKINAPGVNIPVTAAEDDDISQCTNAGFADCFGQASVINVNSGFTYDQPGFTVDVVFNVNKPGAEILHVFDDGTIDENMVACGAVPMAPCYQATTAMGKTFVTLYMLENGKIFGH